MAEWFKAAVLKTAGGASSPWVRILLPPLFFWLNSNMRPNYRLLVEQLDATLESSPQDGTTFLLARSQGYTLACGAFLKDEE